MHRLLVVAVRALLAACAPSDSPATDAGTARYGELVSAPFSLTPEQQQGRVIYETMCWTCHGISGRGDGPAVSSGAAAAPPSFHSEAFVRMEPGELQQHFAAGVSGSDVDHPHMQYVSSLLKPERFREALSFIPALAYPTEIPGSALGGETLYAFRCSACHGSDGRGEGRAAASLVEIAPADFTSDTLLASQDWDAVYRRIREGGREVHGSAMPPWGVVFSDEETWDLVAYLATFQGGLLSEPVWSR